MENRTVNLVISTTKLAAGTVIRAGQRYLESQKQKKRARSPDGRTHGKQSVKELIGQQQGVSKVDVDKTDLKGFERYARKYGVDYAIRKDRSADPPRYYVFFKAKDSDALSAAFSEYAAFAARKRSRTTLLDRLKDYKAQAKAQPTRAAPHKEQSL